MDTEHEEAWQHREQTDRPEPAKARPDLTEEAQTPEAMRAAQITEDGEQEAASSATRVRGVEWVRPTDLMARHGATVAGRGIDFQAELARRAREPVADRLHRLGDRARQLPPLSAFGRGHPTPSGPRRSGVGKS